MGLESSQNRTEIIVAHRALVCTKNKIVKIEMRQGDYLQEDGEVQCVGAVLGKGEKS